MPQPVGEARAERGALEREVIGGGGKAARARQRGHGECDAMLAAMAGVVGAHGGRREV